MKIKEVYRQTDATPRMTTAKYQYESQIKEEKIGKRRNSSTPRVVRAIVSVFVGSRDDNVMAAKSAAQTDKVGETKNPLTPKSFVIK